MKESVGINGVSIRGCVTESHFRLDGGISSMVSRNFSLNPLSRITQYPNGVSMRFSAI